MEVWVRVGQLRAGEGRNPTNGPLAARASRGPLRPAAVQHAQNSCQPASEGCRRPAVAIQAGAAEEYERIEAAGSA
jgi:hypothetical protein